MAFSLDYKTLNDDRFYTSLAKLSAEVSIPDFKTSYNIGKIKRRCAKEIHAARDEHQKILKDCAQWDEEGKLVKEEGKMYTIKPEKQETYEAKMKDFLEHEFEVDCWKVEPDKLGETPLTPDEVMALEPIMEISE